MKTRTVLLAFTLCVSGPPALSQSDRSGPLEASWSPLLCRSDMLLGLRVSNAAERHLGEIGDVLLDARSGEIRYAILELRGIIGLKEEERIVPWSFLEIVPDEAQGGLCHVRTALTEEEVLAAPQCKRGQDFDAALEARIHARFSADVGSAPATEEKPMLVWLRKVDGVVVKNTASEELGKIEELVLSCTNDAVAYIVVDLADDLGSSHIALPWARLRLTHDQEGVLVASTPVDVSQLQVAPVFDPSDWPRMSSPTWMNELCAYYDCDPLWKTSRFAAASKER